MLYVFCPSCAVPYTSVHLIKRYFTRHVAALTIDNLCSNFTVFGSDRRMCSGAVRGAITSVFDDENFSPGAPIMIVAQESVKMILARVDADENNHEAFDKFAVVVMEKMNSAAAVPANASSQRR